MAKCENCYHYEMCQSLEDCNKIKKINASSCNFYMDKSLIVELPCKVGDTVYHIPRNPHGHIIPLAVIAIHILDKELIRGELHESRIVAVGLNTKFGGPFNFDDFGKSIFLTREDAEKVLNAQNNA